MDATVVVVEDEDRQVGLVVDELVGRQQVVVKSLGQTLQDIPGISGGAIMPDGRVGLILDIGGLIEFAGGGGKDRSRAEIGPDVQKTIAA
jgi:two-component system chemotaxis sensor kinase CheA